MHSRWTSPPLHADALVGALSLTRRWCMSCGPTRELPIVRPNLVNVCATPSVSMSKHTPHFL